MCGGKRTVTKDVTLKINIPRGVTTENYVTIPNMGDEHPESLPGDLLVKIVEKEDPVFKREGYDLLCNQDISFSQAVLGSAVHIDVLGLKTIKVNIRSGIQSGQKLRIPGEGAYLPGKDQRGDLIICVNVITPIDLTKEQEEIFKKLQKEGL